MGLFDDNSFEEQLWTDAWIDEVNKVQGGHGSAGGDWAEIQGAINSGLYSREEIKDLYFLDDEDLEQFDTFMLDD